MVSENACGAKVVTHGGRDAEAGGLPGTSEPSHGSPRPVEVDNVDADLQAGASGKRGARHDPRPGGPREPDRSVMLRSAKCPRESAKRGVGTRIAEQCFRRSGGVWPCQPPPRSRIRRSVRLLVAASPRRQMRFRSSGRPGMTRGFASSPTPGSRFLYSLISGGERRRRLVYLPTSR
jgi:hypothetical protein